MTNPMRKTDTARLRKALEKTVPSSEFSVEATKRELEKTTVMETRSLTPQQYLLKTETDPTGPPDTEDTSPVKGFSTTSLVPPELLEEGGEGERTRFEIAGEAGSGGSARVYRLLDRSLGRTIALKLLRGRARNKQGVKQRFVHEARVTAMLEHPNIVPVYDIGVTDDDRLYFLMKNVSGVSVGDAIRAARQGAEVPTDFRTIENRLRILLKVCDALAFAHHRGYIHQDIKPDNIMLGPFGEVLVLDWGCALGERERGRGAAGTYGTPAYMSPEQARREGADERSDVYCLGATLYQMVTLHHPTWSEDPDEFWEMKRHGRLSPLPEEIRESVPGAVLAIARKAMAADPDRRYQSVIAFQNALSEYQTHAESIALATSAIEQLAAVGEQGEYHEYARLTARFEQALEMWGENHDARRGVLEVRRRHARRALERGDLALAQSIAGDRDELAEVREAVEQERQRRLHVRTRMRRTIYAAIALGVILLGAFAYYVVDYFRYFGKWQRLCHVEFTEETADLSELIFSGTVLTGEEEPGKTTPEGLLLPGSHMFWARTIRERGDVRVEVVAQWPERVDGLEIMLNTRREQGKSFAMCPTGYSCQFGSWKGVVNVMSRNTRPRFPDQGNSVGCNLEPGREYRLWFQRVGEELSLFVDGKRVFRVIEPLPLPGEGLEWVAVRSWTDVLIKSFTVWRMGAPEKTTPLIAGDMFVQRGRLHDAAEVYLRIAQDHPGTRLEEQALIRAYLAASQAKTEDSLRTLIRERMRGTHPNSWYWPLLLEADCMAAWKDRDFGRALDLADQVLEGASDSRVALRMISGRPDEVPVWAIDSTLHLLSRTTEVYGLSLEGAGISDLSPLRGLPIRSLALRENRIPDLSPLRGMPLELLLISSNPVSDLSPLEGMDLATLEANACEIASIDPLAGMPLNVLSLGHNNVSDIDALGNLPLSILDVQYNDVQSIKPLRGMNTLRELNLTATNVSDLSPLRGIPLRRLNIGFLPVASLAPLRGMPLRRLGAGDTRVSDLGPLRGMKLEQLTIDNLAVSSLAPLKGMPLTELNLVSCGIGDLSPLTGMPLRCLRCADNSVESLSALRGAPVEELHIDNNDIAVLSPLVDAPLRILSVRANPLRNLKPFEDNSPRHMIFDTVAAGPAYTESILERWGKSGDTLSARLCRTALAFRRGNRNSLMQLAVPWEGHRYLYIPVPLTFGEAREAAEELGGHLVTITGENESRFVYSLLPDRVGGWLGIDTSHEPLRWLTGEPLTFKNFNSRAGRSRPLPKYMVGGWGVHASWYVATNEGMHAGLIVEWDF